MAIELIRRSYEAPLLSGDPEQSAAIAHRGSPLVIRGAAGTGKTRTLIEAAYSRIREGQDPDSILLITFGRERASQLRDDVALRTSATMREPLARTFHSLAFSILKMKSEVNLFDPILLSGPEQESFIRELIEGIQARDHEAGSPLAFWPVELHKAVGTSGFVREVRDVILRSTERKLSYKDLDRLGKEFDEPFWSAVARFWREYEEVMWLRESGTSEAKMRLDPSEIIVRAISVLQKDSQLLASLRQRFATVIVDEFQESDPVQRELLAMLAGDDIIIAVDAASAVGRFRGADPDGVEQALAPYLARGEAITLTTQHRECQTPSTHLFRSENEEAQFIAQAFKREHLTRATSYSDMAVILRSPGSLAGALRRAFIQVGIPVAGYLDVLGKNPSLAPFILLAQIATGDKPLTLESAERLLLAEFGGADSISLRRIRRALLLQKKEEDARTGNQLLIDAIDKGEIFIEEKSALVRVHELLDTARRAARKPGASAESVLGAIWDNARNSQNEKISDAWRKTALKNNARSIIADRDLDAMIQLFDEAARFSERMPGSKPALFLRQISQENIAADIITSKGVRPEAVEILTVHSAKGREWDLVAVAGVQDGLWPNLKQRSSLLGSEKLVEHLRYPDIPKNELRAIAAKGLAEDEARLFHVALTRSQGATLVTAVSDDEIVPSPYFEDLVFAEQVSHSATAPTPEISANELRFTEHERQLSMSALVAELRRIVECENGSLVQGRFISPELKKLAASLLKTLAAEGVALAQPENWYGFRALSSNEPVVSSDQSVPVSPSGGEAFEECGLKWFLERNGGTNGETTSQLLGTVIHEFARIKAEDPSISTDDLYQRMERAWKVIDSNTGWLARSGLQNAIAMIDRFIAYHEKNLKDRSIVGVEKRFTLHVGRALISGSADRIEVTSNGELFVIDFKTGITPVPAKKIEENLQLAAYQLAAVLGQFKEANDQSAHRDGEIKVAGAELAYLALPQSQGIASRKQKPLTPEKRAEVEQRLSLLAEGMGAATFVAKVGKNCRACGVATSCPLQSQGRTVISS